MANGNGNGNGSKNGNGSQPPANGNGQPSDKPKRKFTEKQRRSFKVIEIAPSVWAGMRECVRLGVVCEQHFKDVWWKQPDYRAEVERRRDAFFDSQVSHARQILRMAVEEAALKQVEMIHDAKNERNALRASENVLTSNGIELGKGNRIDIHNRVTVESSQAEFNSRLSNHLSDRFSGIK